jgi:outer membrane receptor protein involved in Fe transport
MGARTRHLSMNVSTTVSGIVRALSICAPVALLDAAPTQAQSVVHTSLVADIPSRPLGEALTAFASQTGLQLVYVSDVVRHRTSHAAAAGLSVDEALAHLLEGTGLQFEYLTPYSVRIIAVTGPGRAVSMNMSASERDELREVIVTANRREEDQQDVPATIEVLTADTLSKLNATTFDDFISDLPGVTAHGVGPGQNDIFMRGLATNLMGIQGAGYLGSFPNVALYIDEQSVQLPGRNLDLYAADLDRIEVLEGPQGTLFGAGAQAGVVRYITNKPKLDVTEGALNAGAATTAHGAPSGSGDATINLPLVANHLAVRAVIYDERRGGYITNSPATFARADSDLGIAYANSGGKVPANSVVINNFNIAGKDTNPVTYKGVRAEVLYRINADWSALLAQSYQGIEADGVFAEMAANSLGQPQPDLSVQLFNPSYNKDRFENTALTIEGRVAALKLVYAGAYLVRNIEQVQDYTAYARGEYADYYQCVNPTSNSATPNPASAKCFSPSSTWRSIERNTHQTHELRLSTPADWRVRGVGGLFYENYKLQDQTDFFYTTATQYFNPIGPPTGYYTPLDGFNPNGTFVPFPVTSINPDVRPPNDSFFNDITRGYSQKAVFTSIDFDLIPSKLTLTAGTRYSSTNTWEVGSTVGAFGCQVINNPNAPNPCVNERTNQDFFNLNAEHLNRTYSGFRSRANLSWHVTDDALVYFTWSQGFRPGGFNRAPINCACESPLNAGPHPWQAQARQYGAWIPPIAYAPDTLTNNELGWKTVWLERRVQWDGAIYQENWNNAQVNINAPNVITLVSTLNAGNYLVRGVETSLAARVTGGLSIEAGGAWNHSELIKEETFYWADGRPIDFSTLTNAAGGPVPNPGGDLGSPLAGAPAFQGNIRARYEIDFNDYHTFAQIGAAHQSHSLSTTNQFGVDLQGNSTAYQLPGFTTYDGALGVGKNAWLVQIYGVNLTDTRAQLFANYAQFYKAVTVNRPRTIGLRFNYKFSSS